MVQTARTEMPPVDEPGLPSRDEPEAETWPRRAVARVDRTKERAVSLASQAPGYEHAVGAFDHDRRHGGGLLAGALAFRLFGAMLPLALVLTVLLGYAGTVDRSAPAEAGKAIGIGPAVLQSMADSAKLSSGTRWTVLISGLVALLWSAASAARAIRAVHSLAWEGKVGRFKRPLPAALALLAAIVAFAAVIAGASRARAELDAGGLIITLAALVAFFGIWLLLSWLLPHADATWRELVPGAVLVAIGVQVIHLGTVLFIGGKIERASDTYGPLGIAFTLLFWLFVVSRVIVGSAMLNAALAQRRRQEVHA